MPFSSRNAFAAAAIAGALLTMPCAPSAEREAPAARSVGEGAVEQTESRVVAIGDIHGALDSFTAILKSTGLIDDQGRWSGGRARLVQTGDYLDRGAEVREVMDLLMRLEGEARRAGGRVEVLFGNHEGMNILRDLRDVSPDAFASFADSDSESRRSRAFNAHKSALGREGRELDREKWLQEHPPGYVEYIEAFGPSGRYGRWLRSRKAVVKVDDSVFMHAGIPLDAMSSIDEVNRTVEREVRAYDAAVSTLQGEGAISAVSNLQEIINAAALTLNNIAALIRDKKDLPQEVTQEYIDRLKGPMSINRWWLTAPNGPLWYRGYATVGEQAQPQIEALLKKLGASRLGVGHTPQIPGRIRSRFGNRVFLIDTGMLTTFYKGGRPSALEIVGDRVTAIYTDEREELVK